jgi:hypothetical protein
LTPGFAKTESDNPLIVQKGAAKKQQINKKKAHPNGAPFACIVLSRLTLWL